jgi:hypothetical protein
MCVHVINVGTKEKNRISIGVFGTKRGGRLPPFPSEILDVMSENSSMTSKPRAITKEVHGFVYTKRALKVFYVDVGIEST